MKAFVWLMPGWLSNRLAILDTAIWLPMVTLVLLDCHSVLPGIGLDALPASAVSNLALTSIGLVLLHRFKPGLDQRQVKASAFALWCAATLSGLWIAGGWVVTALAEWL